MPRYPYRSVHVRTRFVPLDHPTGIVGFLIDAGTSEFAGESKNIRPVDVDDVDDIARTRAIAERDAARMAELRHWRVLPE